MWEIKQVTFIMDVKLGWSQTDPAQGREATEVWTDEAHITEIHALFSQW